MIGHPFAIGMIHISCLRFWLLYYQLMWYNKSINIQWESILNEDLYNNDTNWFIKNKSKYGNYLWLKWKAVFISCFLIILCEIVIFCSIYYEERFTQHWFILIYSMFFIIPMPVLLYIYKYMPKFTDYLKIRNEILFTILVGIIMILINVVGSCLVEFIKISEQYSDYYWLASLQLFNLTNFGFIIIQLVYVNYAFNNSSDLEFSSYTLHNRSTTNNNGYQYLKYIHIYISIIYSVSIFIIYVQYIYIYI